VVHNHWGPTDFELYGFDVGSASRFYTYTNANICCTPWGDRPNYASPGVRSFIIDNFKMWMDEYHIDGFRWDAVGAMRYYDPGHVNIPDADSLIQYLNNTEIRANRPGVISIAEDEAFGQGFHGEWDRGFGDLLIGQVVEGNDTNRNMNALWDGINGNGFFRIAYSETHDPGWLSWRWRATPAHAHSTADPAGITHATSMLAAGVTMTMPASQLFMGQRCSDRQFSARPTRLDSCRPIPTS
jgi:1,4-alpha-glucan branching enzyme